MSALLETGEIRADARHDYLALLKTIEVLMDEYDAITSNYDDAALAVMDARERIREYFSGNIIHKDISIGRPAEGLWMQIPILGDQLTIYTRSPEEVQLINKFLERRTNDITTLTNDYDTKFSELKNWLKPSMDATGSMSELDLKLDLAEYEMELASVKRSYEYVKFLQVLADYRNSIG